MIVAQGLVRSSAAVECKLSLFLGKYFYVQGETCAFESRGSTARIGKELPSSS
jgi:hypothetical protein